MRNFLFSIDLVSNSSSVMSPSTFFATAAALIQNKTVLDMRNRNHLSHLSPNNLRESTTDEVGTMNIRDYLHVPGKA